MTSDRDDGENSVLAQIGREFRNPVTISLGALEAVMARADIPADVKAQLDTAHRNNMKLLQLFNGVIDLNLVETGRARNRLEPTDLSELTRQIAEIFAKTAQDNKLSFVVEIDDVGILYIDQDKWKGIVMNLLMYALGLTFDGEVKLRLGIENGQIRLDINDTSPGVPEDQIPKLFKAFYRIDFGDGTSKEGMGLSIVKQYAEKLNGSVEARSTVGQGTCFTIRIPMDLEHHKDDSVQLARLSSDLSTTAAPYINALRKWLPDSPDNDDQTASSNVIGLTELRIDRPRAVRKARPTILIVEDNIDLKNFLDGSLAATYELSFAETGNAAISLLRSSEPFDLVITEQVLPDLHGREILSTVRQDPVLRQTPVMIVTDRSMHDVDHVMRDIGADDYRVKPFAKFELLAAVRNMLEKTKLRRDTEDALRQAQRMESVGLITGGIAHDFSNLLLAIIGNVELAQRRAHENPDISRLLSNAMQAAMRGKKLTEHLVAFSAERTQDIKALNPNDVISSMGDLLSKALGGMSGISTRLGKNLWPTKADFGALELSMLNLAINAREAMPEGGDVTIETQNIPQRIAPGAAAPADYIKISMRDTGEGIPADALPQVFEAYFTTKQGRHSGLGLTQVQSVAAQFGGDVQIESTVGVGTSVSIYLPRTNEVPEVETSAPVAAPATDNPSYRILIVDDEDAVREVMYNLVKDLGHTAAQANSGRQALSLLETASYDLIILDYAMPGMTGIEVASRVRALYPAQRILFSTGFTDTRALTEQREVILRKPYETWDLEVKIASAMRDDKPSGPGAQVVQLRKPTRA